SATALWLKKRFADSTINSSWAGRWPSTRPASAKAVRARLHRPDRTRRCAILASRLLALSELVQTSDPTPPLAEGANPQAAGNLTGNRNNPFARNREAGSLENPRTKVRKMILAAIILRAAWMNRTMNNSFAYY